MKFNWFMSAILIAILAFTSNYASEAIVGLAAGAETESQLYRQGVNVAVLVFLIWFVNIWLYTMMMTVLPVHPLLMQSLLFFRKKTNAMLIVFLSLIGYTVAFVGTGQYALAAGAFVASTIAWEKVRFPFDFYKAHVVEYEGNLKKNKSEESIDNDGEDH